MSTSGKIAILLAGLVALQLACAASPRPVTGPYATADSIAETEIQKELQSVPGTAYPVLFLLLGAPVGAFGGCLAGATIVPDEDYGPCLVGGFFGLVGGIAGGLTIGVNLSEKSRRTEAIRRIRVRRSTR